MKLKPKDGSVLGTFPVGPLPTELAFDGSSIWATNASAHSAQRLRRSDGTIQNTIEVGNSPAGILFDGTSIWVANFSSNTVTKISP
jgi:DNA-binding beta-propeller fold protein YncE